LPHSSNVDLSVYDVAGRLIAVLARGAQTPGSHKIVWEAAGVSSGMYFVKMRAGDFQATRKILLLR
jgi:hypothetical protein